MKVDLKLEPENGQDNQMHYSQVMVEINFKVEKKAGKTVTTSYIIRIDDVAQNDHYKNEILKNLASRAGG